VARLSRTPEGYYSGPIWYVNGDTTNFPYNSVTIRAVSSFFPNQKVATATFTAPAGATRTRHFRYISRYFHPCEFEYDVVEGTQAVTSINTGAHPNRPNGLPSETLSIEKVYQRTGFGVSQSPGSGTIPIDGAGVNQAWSDSEMHDAMQVYWLRFANKAQWALWTLFASLHEQGTGLGGIMFDDIGPNQRQGTAIFEDSFISQAPPNDPNPAAWVARMKFWTAVHEIGHTFNLAHSWQKTLGVPWIPLANEAEARSFMNYPYSVQGGESAFFSSFEYRFSDQELLFLRHAPERLVQQGNALWFDHHGFEQTRQSQVPQLTLELRVNRAQATYEFMEPVAIELKLKNVSGESQVIDDRVLATFDRLTVVIKKEGRAARQFRPFAHYCWRSGKTVLQPGEAVYESLFVGAGSNGWDVAEPGRYVLQAALHLDDEDVVSPPLPIRIAPPKGYEEENLAQDLFTEDVGRTLAFDGTKVLEGANNVLREISEKLPDSRAAIHARVALALPLARQYRALTVDAKGSPDEQLVFRAESPKLTQAVEEFKSAVGGRQDRSAESLGHIDYAYYAVRMSEAAKRAGAGDEAREIGDAMISTLNRRGVPAPILNQLREKLGSANETGAERRSRHSRPGKQAK
jgi:reprolysin-like metallo-peptidase family M12B